MTESPSYWHGELFIEGGKAWGVAANGDTVCLGNAESIIPAAEGKVPIPEGLSTRVREILEDIREEAGFGETGKLVGASHLPRAGRGRIARSRH